MINNHKESQVSIFEFSGYSYDVMRLEGGSELDRNKGLTALFTITESLAENHEILIATQLKLVVDSQHKGAEVVKGEIDRVYNSIYEELEAELDLLPSDYTVLMYQAIKEVEVEVNILLLVGGGVSNLINESIQIITGLYEGLSLLGLSFIDYYKININQEDSVRSGVFKLSEFSI